MKIFQLITIIFFINFTALAVWKPNTSDNIYTGKNDFEVSVDMDAGLGVSGDTITESLYFGTSSERMKFPTTRGTIGQVLQLDVDGNVIWEDPSGGSSSEVTWQGDDGVSKKGNKVKVINATITQSGGVGTTVEVTVEGGGGTGEVTLTGLDGVSKTGNKILMNNATITKTGTTTEVDIAHNNTNSLQGGTTGEYYHLPFADWLKVISDSFSDLLVTNDLTVKDDVLVSGEVRITGKVKASTIEGDGSKITNVLHSEADTLSDVVARGNITPLNIIAGGLKATTGNITTFTVSDVRASSDISTNLTFVGKQIATPDAPLAGYTKLYSKADGKWYYMTSSTGETAIGTGSGGGSSYIAGNGINISGSTISAKLNGSTLSNGASGLSVTTPWTGTSEVTLAGSNGVGRKGNRIKFTNSTLSRIGDTIEVTATSPTLIAGDGITVSGLTVTNNIDTTNGGLKFDSSSPKKVLINPLYGLEIVSNYLQIKKDKGIDIENNGIKVALAQGLDFTGNSIEVKLNGSSLSRSASGLSVTNPWTGTSEIFVAGSNGVGRKGDKLKFTNGTVTRSGNTVEVSVTADTMLTVKDEGTTKTTTANAINFTGDGVSVSMSEGIPQITINGGGSSSPTQDYVTLEQMLKLKKISYTSIPTPSSNYLNIFQETSNGRLYAKNNNGSIYQLSWTYVVNSDWEIMVDATRSSSSDFLDLTGVNTGELTTYNATTINCKNTNVHRGVYKSLYKNNCEFIATVKVVTTTSRIYFGIYKAYNNFNTSNIVAGCRIQDNARVFHYINTSDTPSTDTNTDGHTTGVEYYIRVKISSFGSTTATASFWEDTTYHSWGDDSGWGTADYTATIKSDHSNWYIGVGLGDDSVNGGIECYNLYMKQQPTL